MANLCDVVCPRCRKSVSVLDDYVVSIPCQNYGHIGPAHFHIQLGNIIENSLPFLILKNQVNSLLNQNRQLIAQLKDMEELFKKNIEKMEEVSKDEKNTYDFQDAIKDYNNITRAVKTTMDIGKEFKKIYSLKL